MKYKKFRVYLWKYINKEMFKDIIEKYKDRINDYVTVMIYEKYEDMYNKVDEIEENKIERNYVGRTYMYRLPLIDEEEKVIGYGKSCGFIHLCDENKELSYETVSHEVAHCVIGYFSRFLYKDNPIKEMPSEYDGEASDYEELFCYMTGNINNAILIKC